MQAHTHTHTHTLAWTDWMDIWKNGWMDIWIYECRHTHIRMDRLDGQIGWIDGRMDG